MQTSVIADITKGEKCAKVPFEALGGKGKIAVLEGDGRRANETAGERKSGFLSVMEKDGSIFASLFLSART